MQSVQNGSVSPWLVVVTSVWFVGVFNLFSIRVVGEYAGKTYVESKRRLRYLVAENLMDQLR
jgi:hypothetical protein